MNWKCKIYSPRLIVAMDDEQDNFEAKWNSTGLYLEGDTLRYL